MVNKRDLVKMGILLFIVCLWLPEIVLGVDDSKIQWSDEILPGSTLYWQITDIHVADQYSPITLGDRTLHKEDILRIDIIEQFPDKLENFYQIDSFPTWIRTYLEQEEFEHPYSGLYKFLICPIQLQDNDSTILNFPDFVPLIPTNISSVMTDENVSLFENSKDSVQLRFTYVWNDHLNVTESYIINIVTGIADNLEIFYVSSGEKLEFVCWNRFYVDLISGYPIYFIFISVVIGYIVILNLIQTKITVGVDSR